MSSSTEGKSQHIRVDALDKVTGRAKYVEDLPDLSGMAYAAAFRSPYSHAQIVSIDTSVAEGLPGVFGVIRAQEFGPTHLNLTRAAGDQLDIEMDKVRFDGDFVGMVAAEDLRTARYAASLVDVQYELLPPVFTADEALAPGAPLVHEKHGTNLAREDIMEWGGIDQALKEADHVFEEVYSCPNVYHHPMEAASSAVVDFHGEQLDLWVPTNSPHRVVDTAVHHFGLKQQQVRVRVPFVGGNFGAKDQSEEALIAAELSRRIKRPIKYVVTDEESFRASSRDATVYKAQVGVKADGTLMGLDVEVVIDTGGYYTGATIITNNIMTSSMGGFRVPHFRVKARTVFTNKVPCGPFRNTGKNQTTFAVDCAMDNIARRMGVDPVEFRLKNLLRWGEFIAPDMWRRSGQESKAVTPPVDTHLDQLIDHAMNAIGWNRHEAKKEDPASSGKVVRGRGLSVSMRRGSHVGTAEAMATLDSDGTVTISHNAPDVGEGAYTMISVVAADTLGVSQSQVRVGEPDTDNQLKFSGTSSQRTTLQMGGAVHSACKELLQKMAAAAARAKGGSPEEWHAEGGKISRDGVSLTFEQVHRAADGMTPLLGLGNYQPVRTGHSSFGGHDHWAPGVAAVEIEVDRETGEIRLLQFATVADAGKILHYPSAKGQIDGGSVMGLGQCLFEELVYQEGQLQNADPFQYRLPLMTDFPQSFRSIILENGDGPGPFGSKAIAQVSIPCVAPAVGNAIFDAVGVRIRSIPFSPEKVLRGLGVIKK
jgi:CO/xanthine dehydrogenase Mo-binding subunit